MSFSELANLGAQRCRSPSFSPPHDDFFPRDLDPGLSMEQLPTSTNTTPLYSACDAGAGMLRTPFPLFRLTPCDTGQQEAWEGACTAWKEQGLLSGPSRSSEPHNNFSNRQGGSFHHHRVSEAVPFHPPRHQRYRCSFPLSQTRSCWTPTSTFVPSLIIPNPFLCSLHP